jgi:hypothetical protein
MMGGALPPPGAKWQIGDQVPDKQMTPTDLKVALAKLGWNQGDLARETGYQPGEISRMCTGKRTVPLILQRFLEARMLIKRLALMEEIR